MVISFRAGRVRQGVGPMSTVLSSEIHRVWAHSTISVLLSGGPVHSLHRDVLCDSKGQSSYTDPARPGDVCDFTCHRKRALIHLTPYQKTIQPSHLMVLSL